MIFIYITENLINGKKYIGSHKTDNANDSYLGSGLYLKKSIKKYGKDSFKRIILEEFDTPDDAYLKEEFYIKKFNTLSPNGYNISPKGGHRVPGGLSNETLIKISKKQKGKSNIGKAPINKGKTIEDLYGEKRANEIRNKIIESNKGKKQSESTIEKRRQKLIGRKNTEETKIKMSLASKGKPKNYDIWNKGKTQLDISKEKIEEIKNIYNKNISQKEIAKLFNLSASCISRILRGYYDEKI